jgi:hypothetical protein
MAEKKRITQAELRKLGIEAGEILSKAFEKVISPYGEAVPINIQDQFLDRQNAEVSGCIQRLRDAGLNEFEIAVWYCGMSKAVKKQGAALLRSMIRKH